jgi:uncharacterized membrane protein (DUF373 family)
MSKCFDANPSPVGFGICLARRLLREGFMRRRQERPLYAETAEFLSSINLIDGLRRIYCIVLEITAGGVFLRKTPVGYDCSGLHRIRKRWKGTDPNPGERRTSERGEEQMNGKSNKEKFIWMFEMATVTALHILIMLTVLVATVVLYVLFIQNILSRVLHIKAVTDLLPAMQTSFAGVLIVLLGLELAETLKAYFAEHQIRVEVILIVAIVAVGRHMIQVDFAHTGAKEVLSLSSLMLSLTVGYFLVKRAQTLSRSSQESEAKLEDKE